MKSIYIIIILSIMLNACGDKKGKTTENNAPQFTATQIMQKAHEKAGGDFWRRPKSLSLKGYGIFYKNGDSVKHEKHNMWRVFANTKDEAHKANGKVRIESFKNDKPVFIVSYDGENTFDLNGKQEKSEADKRWASNFGYGAIRHALDDGYELQLMEDDSIAEKAVYQVKVIDKTKAETFFGIDKEDFKIVKVTFNTPRGWHYRIYSEFFSKEEYTWLQSGKVELFYNDILSNTIYWEDFDVNKDLPDNLFTLNTSLNEK